MLTDNYITSINPDLETSLIMKTAEFEDERQFAFQLQAYSCPFF